MLPKSDLPEIQHFLPCDPACGKQKFCKKIWEKIPPKIRSFFYISPVEIPLLFILSFHLLFTNYLIEKIGIALSDLIQVILEVLYIHFFFKAISTKSKYISSSYTDFNHDDPIAQYLKIKFTDFKTWLQEYLTSNNSPLDYSAHIKKNPIEILISIFKPQKKDFKFIWAVLIILTIHLSLYYFNLIYFVDVLRIILTATVVVYVIKNIYSAYMNSSLIVDSFKSHPLQFFTSIIALGGLSALIIPATMNIFKLIGDSTALTTAMLGITGGIIAVFGLIKSHQKSELEREQLEVQKQKDNRDYIRQVHAARRDRYIEAVDKLSSKNASVRLGGVYALVGLVDEWLEDDNIDRETQIKEGQVIINNLCAYIRSPFPLAEKIDEYKAYKKFEEVMQKYSKGLLEELDFPDWIVLNKRFPSPQNYKKPKNITKDYAMFSEEQNVRRTIFDEMSKRSSTFTKNEKGEIIETISEMWSDFDFDFSRAPVFYSLGDLKIEKGNFSTAKFYFYAGARFNSATFIEKADFLGATFIDRADFANVTFAKGVDFSWAEFSYASFYTAKFIGKKSYFTNANFSEAIFFGARFSENAIFCRATFTNYAEFLSTTFTGSVNFSGAVFDRTAVFADTTFTSAADFSGATFTLSEPHFTGVTTSGIELKARFSAAANPQDYIFSVASGSKPINRKPATLLGKTFNIPLGTVLFDPDSPKDQLGNYAVQSDPAK